MSILEFRRVSLEEAGQAPVRGVEVSVEPGERLVVFGRSGSGKGTFLKLAAGILEPTSGTVRIATPSGRLAVGYIPNEGGLLNNLSLLHNVMLPAVYHKLLDFPEAEERARSLLDELGAASQAGRRPAAASVSARRLTQFARALLVEPAVLVMDDPLEDVDAATARTIRGLVERIGEKGEVCAILGTGSLGHYLDWGGRFLLFREGEAVLFEGRRALLGSEDPEVRACLG